MQSDLWGQLPHASRRSPAGTPTRPQLRGSGRAGICVGGVASGKRDVKAAVQVTAVWAEAAGGADLQFAAKPAPGPMCTRVCEMTELLAAPWLCPARSCCVAGVWDVGPALRGPPAPWGMLQVVTLKFTGR